MIGHLLSLLISTAAAQQPPLTVLTVAPDGRWGTATDDHIYIALATAVERCLGQTRILGCGAYQVEVRRGWLIGHICGDHVLVAADIDRAEAERVVAHHEAELRSQYQALPPCTRLATIDPTGTPLRAGARLPCRPLATLPMTDCDRK